MSTLKQWLMGLLYSSLLLIFLFIDFVKWIVSLNAAALKLKKNDRLKRDWQWGQKFGLLPLLKPEQIEKPQTLLIHCASMGEVVASIELLKALVQHNSNLSIVVTTNTLTGKQQLARSIKNTELENRVVHNYLPIDLNGLMRRFIKFIQPDLVMIMEVEMWPNFIKQVNKFGAPLVIVNGRMTDKTCAGYLKYPSLSKPMLSNIDYIFARNSGDFKNYQKLAISSEKLELVGNIKFDIELPNSDVAEQLRDSFGLSQRKVIVAGSTHEGEERALIESFEQLCKSNDNLLLLIAPRHPHRFDEVNDLLLQQQLQVTRMSEQPFADRSTQVLLGDQMGQLSNWYGIADIVFIGGSLVKRGGHNPIEAAAFAKPIVMGPHIYNNPEIIQTLADDGGLSLVDDQLALLQAFESLLDDQEVAVNRGEKALNTLKNNQGVIEKIVKKVSADYLD